MEHWDTDSRKIFADFYIDDRNYPLQDINWKKFVKFIKEYKKIHSDYYV